jgi:hypothetical protein
MRFVTWLWEQIDEQGASSKFAKIAWDDVNNGCAHGTFGPAQWIEHFSIKHPEAKAILIEGLLKAYDEYQLETK